MRKYILLMVLVLVLGTLKGVLAENITFYLSTSNVSLDGRASISSGVGGATVNLETPPYASAEWTFTLPENCTEITYIKIVLEVYEPDGDKVYLNGIYIGTLRWHKLYSYQYFEINDSVLEQIKNAKTLTLRVEKRAGSYTFSAIRCRKYSDTHRSYIYVEYKTANDDNNPQQSTKAPIPTTAIVVAAFITTLTLFKRR